MSKYIVRAKITFNDIENNVLREPGHQFEVSEERYEVLKRHNAVDVIEKIGTVDKVDKTEEEKAEEIGAIVEETVYNKPKKKKK